MEVIQATFRGGETIVSLNVAEQDVPKALALIEASLGTLEPDRRRGGIQDYRMVRNAGITYFVTLDPNITIHIPHQQPAKRWAE